MFIEVEVDFNGEEQWRSPNKGKIIINCTSIITVKNHISGKGNRYTLIRVRYIDKIVTFYATDTYESIKAQLVQSNVDSTAFGLTGPL